jgi:hypothetical protein
MTAQQTKQLWRNLVDDKFKGEAEYYRVIIDRLKRMKFAHNKPKHGKHSSGKLDDSHCVYCYTRRHFPSLLRLFEVKLQADVPARAKRTRLEHHSPKRNQLRLLGGNQLPLF